MSGGENGSEKSKHSRNIVRKIVRIISHLSCILMLLLVIKVKFLPNYRLFLTCETCDNLIISYLLAVLAMISTIALVILIFVRKIERIERTTSPEISLEKYKLRLQANKELQEKYINAKLKLKPLKHSFLISLSTTIIGGLSFLLCVLLYWRFQNTFIIEPKFYNIKNDFCKLALVVLSRTPIIVFFIVGLLICKRCFTLWDKYRDYLSLWEYHSKINDKDKQDDLLIALAPNYFGTKRNRRSDNNFMEKLLLKMIPTLNINAGDGSNNGNNGGQNGGQTHG